MYGNTSDRRWVPLVEDIESDSAPNLTIDKSTAPMIAAGRDAGATTILTVRYVVGGIWEAPVGEYLAVDVPRAAHIDDEGAPAIPTQGLFVALPEDAANVEIRVVDKTSRGLDDDVLLIPAPKQVRETEYVEDVFEADPAIYESDEAYPGRDFEYFGLKKTDGVHVAHILVYLGQYRPVSRRLDVVESMTLEISYTTPPSSDRHPGRKPREGVLTDLIVGYELLDEATDFQTPAGDLSMLDETDVMVLETLPSASWTPGMSLLEDVVEEAADPSVLLERPELIHAHWLELQPVAKLKNKNIISEYVIVTTPDLAKAVEPLLHAKQGWPHFARVVLTTDIQSEFSGSSLEDSIRSFVHWAYDNWKVPPRFVVLAGDTDTIPIHTYQRTSGSYASDHFYADFSGDLAPEIAVSRLPTSDPNTMKAMCGYIALYGGFRGGDWGGWQSRVLLCAYQSATYENACDSVASTIGGRYQVIKRYAEDTTKADVEATLNQGVLFAVYRGHGSKTKWSSTNGLDTTDIKALANQGRPPFVLSICCQNGWIDDNTTETVSEAFMRDRKAVAVFAASRDSWTYPNNDFLGYLFDAVMVGNAYTPAAIIRYAKTKMVRDHPTSSNYHDNLIMYNLMGDPTAHVASNVEYYRGEWGMDHDGWKGDLNISRIHNYRIRSQPGSKAPVWDISGKYKAASGQTYNFKGELGGFDSNHIGAGTKRSDHKIEFDVEFSQANRQRFVGYVHTWTRDAMSGYTWWSKRPFGWTAKKH